MPRLDIVRSVDLQRTPRLLQMEGLFDVAPSQRSEERWTVDIDLPESWNVGLIVGPSGAGKTTVARELFGEAIVDGWEWPHDRSILDGFPAQMSIKDIVALLSSVGFSSPPSWVRPFHVLSNGEQFRVNLARTLAEQPDLAVVDEFTSVVDRTVAQIGSAAVAKTVRRRNQRFVAVSCHYDIAEWLEPDWIFEPHTSTLDRRSLRRPPITLEIARVHHSAWSLFRKHHYLDTSLNKAAACFVAFWNGTPVAFSAWMPFPSGTLRNAWREHRTVCLPDFQGVGIGNAVSEYCASLLTGQGKIAISTTSHPAMIRARASSHIWKMQRKPSRTSVEGRDAGLAKTRATNRLSAGFRYVGPALDRSEAVRVWGAS